VISEDKIREWQAGRSSSALLRPAANSVPQIPALNLVAFQAISNRNLTTRRASASRLPSAHLVKEPSAPRRTTRGICSKFSNRELELLEPLITDRKQTTAPSSNRELPTKRNSKGSQVRPRNLPQIRKWSRPLLTGSALQREFDLTYRKQTTEKFLTGARTHIRETPFCAKMSLETNVEMSEEMKAIR